MADISELDGFDNFESSTISDILTKNFVYFFDWGFASSGAYTNVNIPGTGFYGTDKSRMQLHSDPNYANGRVWQTQRQNWVWESGLSRGTPVPVTGVFVNNNFVSSGYKIKPKEGQVVFDSPISPTSNVRISHSTKRVNVLPIDSVPWLKNIQRRSFESSSSFGGSGEFAMLGQTRVQLPAITVDVIPPKDYIPYQLGGGKEHLNDVIFHVVAESSSECKELLDKICFQSGRTIKLFNPSTAAVSGVRVFDGNGFLSNSANPSGTYPNLVNNFYYRLCYIGEHGDINVTELDPKLSIGSIRFTTQVRD